MKRALKIKVCGMRGPGNIEKVAALGPDYMGFIFHDPSPRCCRGIAAKVVASLPDEVVPVLVSVDMPEVEIVALSDLLGISTLQLHGSESPDLCMKLKRKGFTVWKAARLESAKDIVALEDYAGAVDAFVFDTPSASYGGTGRKFNWQLLDDYDLPVDFILSGGIGEDDVEAISSFPDPRFAGIDLNSRFEVAPGVKDEVKLRKFINEIRQLR